MKLYEYEANSIFKKYGIPVVEGYLIKDSSEIRNIDGRIALKSQILAGGRGKAGGIKFADTAEVAKKTAREMLSSNVNGFHVKKIFIQKAVGILDEFYIGITIDRNSRKAVIIVSSEGGMDIEEIAERHSDRIVKYEVNPDYGVHMFSARNLAKKIGFKGKDILTVANIVYNLYRVFDDYDAELAEINPLVLTKEGLAAVDAKLNIDDNALYRHNDIVRETEEYTNLEKKAKESDLSYVELDGNIAVIGCGAGLVMASLDAISHYGGKPANFLDLGGGANSENMKKGLEIVLMKKNIKSVFINIFGGITRCDEIARGIAEFKTTVPLAIRMVGTNEEEGKKILRDNNYKIFETMEDAAEYAVRANGNTH